MKFKENLVEIMKQEKVAVHCDTEEKSRALLEELGKCGVRWFNGDRASLHPFWNIFKKDTCYNINDGCVWYSSDDLYTNDDYRIIEFEELLEEPMNNEASMAEINDIVNSLESEAEMECSAAIKQA